MSAATRSLGRLATQSSVLFVCDIQERFRPLIYHTATVVDTAKRMIRGANLLGVPVLVTEQYPKALGPTVTELQEVLLPSAHKISKTQFSMITPEVQEVLHGMPSVRQVLLLGIEAHVCVLQTSLDLIDKGYEVHLLVDGVSSQRPHDRSLGIQRISQAGGLLSTSEMALFQLMRDKNHPAFKEISNLAKEQRAEPIPFSSCL